MFVLLSEAFLKLNEYEKVAFVTAIGIDRFGDAPELRDHLRLVATRCRCSIEI
jgi:hypothetical protein